MAWRPHGNAPTDPSEGPTGVCDSCGFWFRLRSLRPQLIPAGTMYIPTNFLVCEKCWDIPNLNLLTIVLPPDPPPVFNARVEQYYLDEVDQLAADEDTPIIPDAGENPLVVNPASKNFGDPPPGETS